MELYVVRHAIAEDGELDDARALTEKGKKRFEKMVELLGRLDVRFDRLVHSPKRRAVETAELLAGLVDGDLEVSELLTEAPSKALLGLLHGARVAIVGHEPHLSALVAWLLTGASAGAVIELKKGAIARLEGDPVPGGMRLCALLPPRLGRA